METEEQLNLIDRKLFELKKDYDLYFSGDLRRPPERMRNEIQKVLVKLTTSHMTNTQQRFRLKSLSARFNSFARHWDRIMHQIEVGTYQPNKFKADMRVGKYEKEKGKVKMADGHLANRMGKGQQAGSDDREVKDLFNAFVETRRVTGENVNVDYKSFKKSIAKNREILKKKGGKNYDFKVMIEKGKAKIKGKIK